MTDILPAWAEPFHLDAQTIRGLEAPSPVTKEWAYGNGSGAGVTVAVVDSGIEQGHPQVGAVAQSVALERDSDSPGSMRVIEGEHEDLYGHGTACAGIIRHLAPNVDLVSVRVLGSKLKGSAYVFLHGLEWCIDNGVDVVNLSMSTANEDYLAAFHDLVDEATFSGMLIVSAMNNERRTTIPSEFAGVFSVACAPGTDREKVWFNPSAPAEWGAAGIEVEVPWLGGGTIVATGNSFAAPVVAGHLARIRSAHPHLTPWQMRTVLAEIAQNTM